MPPKTSSDTSIASPDLNNLLAYTTRCQQLLTTFQTTLQSPAVPSTSLSESAKLTNNPLSVLRDAAKLLHAHTTKLSLMIINKPFGAKSIHGELRASVEECVMAMMSAIEILGAGVSVRADKVKTATELPGSPWGKFTAKEARIRVGRVVREMVVLTDEVHRVCEDEAKSVYPGRLATKRDSLASTGVLWEACDALVAFERLGVPGIAVWKVQIYYQTLKDAITELKEWGTEEEDDDDEDETAEDEGEEKIEDGFETDEDLEDMFKAANKLPKDDKALRTQLDNTTKKLQLVSVLYQALLKRRLKTFSFETNLDALTAIGARERIKAINQLVESLEEIPESVDEIACAFYDLDSPAAAQLLESIIDLAKQSVHVVQKSWTGTDDEFTTWSNKWLDNIDG